MEIGTDEIERSSVVSFGLPAPQRPNPVEPGNAGKRVKGMANTMKKARMIESMVEFV